MDDLQARASTIRSLEDGIEHGMLGVRRRTTRGTERAALRTRWSPERPAATKSAAADGELRRPEATEDGDDGEMVLQDQELTTTTMKGSGKPEEVEAARNERGELRSVSGKTILHSGFEASRHALLGEEVEEDQAVLPIVFDSFGAACSGGASRRRWWRLRPCGTEEGEQWRGWASERACEEKREAARRLLGLIHAKRQSRRWHRQVRPRSCLPGWR